MIAIINTGGTFTKRYDPIQGELIVPQGEEGIQELLASQSNLAYRLVGVVHKDSLQMNDADREEIVKVVAATPEREVVVIHGTDTMHLTAACLEAARLNKAIVLIGAMIPASISPTEAALHLGMALGFLIAHPPTGVYIAMHGAILPHQRIIKDRSKGQFVPIS
ncbi:MAG: asparaginase domain-containing protein [Campylobacterales bacterium]